MLEEFDQEVFEMSEDVLLPVLHRLRQDGILRHWLDANTRYAISQAILESLRDKQTTGESK